MSYVHEASRYERTAQALRPHARADLAGSYPFLAHLVRDLTFLDTHILPLLEEARGAQDWYVAHRYEGKDGSYSRLFSSITLPFYEP